MFNKDILTKLLYVAFVAVIMLPMGRILFPYVSHELSASTRFSGKCVPYAHPLRVPLVHWYDQRACAPMG